MHKVLFSLVFLLFFTIPAFSWDDVGHKITAYIAWQEMSPAARDNVIRILRAAPEDSQIGALYQVYGLEPDAIRAQDFFMLVASWADIVRDREYPVRYKKYHRGNWHYADTFWKQNGDKAELLEGFKDNGLGLVKLAEFDKVARDPSASNAEKALAIAWLIHIIGDLHQPLHTSGRVTDLEPKGDQGGNLFILTPKGTPRKDQLDLHWFWDSIVVRYDVPKNVLCENEYIDAEARKIMKKYPYESLKGVLDVGNYQAIERESFALVPTNVFTPDLVRNQLPSKAYRKNAFKVAQRRLALAGYRIGTLFDSLFSTPASGKK